MHNPIVSWSVVITQMSETDDKLIKSSVFRYQTALLAKDISQNVNISFQHKSKLCTHTPYSLNTEQWYLLQFESYASLENSFLKDEYEKHVLPAFEVGNQEVGLHFYFFEISSESWKENSLTPMWHSFTPQNTHQGTLETSVFAEFR